MERPEGVAPDAVAKIEIVPDDGEHHWVRTIEKVPVLNRLDGRHRRQLRSPPAVPARPVAGFGFGGV